MSKPIILITGGRDFNDVILLAAALNEINPGLVIHGNAKGADRMAGTWAKHKGIHSLACDALWGAYSNAAGPKRNAVMVEVCKRLGGSVVAFPGGSGTADCVRRAKAAGLAVREVSP